MAAAEECLDQKQFINHFLLHAPQIMWFLGAGASRTSGMPTATDILWDLKRRYYCIHENQNLQDHDVDKRATKARIQTYLDGKGFPKAFSAEEYSFYFDLLFGSDHSAQQKYISEQLSSDNLNLSVGSRVLAALLATGLSKIAFTTNFDEVIETAFSRVIGKVLSTFNLEGSYAALDAMNSEKFPIYAKLHGDFRYRNIKNLAVDLLRNDEEIQRCFLAASTRFGMVVSGYSGRDANIMEMFNKAIEQNNAFPRGLIWTTIQRAEVAPSVTALLKNARSKGINAHLLDAGTFDALLLKVWKLLPSRDPEIERKVQSGKSQSVYIELKEPGKNYPIIRTNGLPIVSWPTVCGKIETKIPVTFTDINEKRRDNQSLILTFTGDILFWGKAEQANLTFKNEQPDGITANEFDNVPRAIESSGTLKSFFEEALATSLCQDRPLLLRRNHRTWYVVANHRLAEDDIFTDLKKVLSYQSNLGTISGAVRGSAKAHWSECVSVRLEERNGSLWLLLRPDVWISPRLERENSVAFLRQRKLYRRNAQSFGLLSAWIEILFGKGSVGNAKEVEVSTFSDSEYCPRFKILTRTAFSARS